MGTDIIDWELSLQVCQWTEGDAAMIGFSPRKAEFSLYVFTTPDAEKLLGDLGNLRWGRPAFM